MTPSASLSLLALQNSAELQREKAEKKHRQKPAAEQWARRKWNGNVSQGSPGLQGVGLGTVESNEVQS